MADKIPDSVWLKIFSYLQDPVAVSKLGAVSRHWYKLSRDRGLWRRLLFHRKLSINKLWMLIRRPQASLVQSLRIEGALKTRKRAHDKNRKTLTAAFLKELQERCPALRELHIVYADISDIRLSEMPENLTFLSLNNSVISFDFLEQFKQPEILPKLTGLDLGYCHNLSSYSQSVPGLLGKKSLTYLSVKHCYKITKSHLIDLIVSLQQLQTLNVSDLENITDDFLSHLSERGPELQNLDISFCRNITHKGLASLSNCSSITKLNLAGTGVSIAGVHSLAKMKGLKFVSLVKTKCKKDAAELLREQLPNCTVDHKFSEASEPVGEAMWFLPMHTAGVGNGAEGEG